MRRDLRASVRQPKDQLSDPVRLGKASWPSRLHSRQERRRASQALIDWMRFAQISVTSDCLQRQEASRPAGAVRLVISRNDLAASRKLPVSDFEVNRNQ